MVQALHKAGIRVVPVSYTHLDVYKRQVLNRWTPENPNAELPAFMLSASNPADVYKRQQVSRKRAYAERGNGVA